MRCAISGACPEAKARYAEARARLAGPNAELEREIADGEGRLEGLPPALAEGKGTEPGRTLVSSRSMSWPVRILGTGAVQPATVVSAEDLDRRLGQPVGTCLAKNGVRTRHFVIRPTPRAP
jgi:hypothetical protein